MSTFDIIIIAAILLALAFVGVRLWLAYRAATGTPWQRFLLVFRNSETILWARAQALIGLLTAASSALLAFAQDPTNDSLIRQLIPDAKYIAIYGLSLAVLGFVTEAIRRHRTIPDPVTGAIDTAPPAPKAGI